MSIGKYKVRMELFAPHTLKYYATYYHHTDKDKWLDVVEDIQAILEHHSQLEDGKAQQFFCVLGEAGTTHPMAVPTMLKSEKLRILERVS